MASNPDPARIKAIMDATDAAAKDPAEPFVPTTMPQTIFMTLEDPTFNRAAKYISNFIMSLIVLGCITYVMETMSDFQTLPAKCRKRVLPESIDIDEDALADGFCHPAPLAWFATLEMSCILIFTVEYIFRLVTVHTVPEHVWNIKEEALEEPEPDEDAPRVKREKGALALTKAYASTFMNCIDLVAIVPFYIEKLFNAGAGLGVIRVMRLTRVLRVLKSPKFAEAVKLFSLSLSASIPALSILFFFSLLGIILMGSLGYFFEHGAWTVYDSVCCPGPIFAQIEAAAVGGVTAGPHVTADMLVNTTLVHECQLGCYVRDDIYGFNHEVSPFTSIPTSFYWVIVTMTTVGYGDLLPTSVFGRIISMIVMYGGIFGLALPITVIGANFSRQYELLNLERERKRKEVEQLTRTGAADAAAHAVMRARLSLVDKQASVKSTSDGEGSSSQHATRTEVSVRPGPSSVRYEIHDVTEQDEAAALAGELRSDMKTILAALPRVEAAVTSNCADAQKLQALLQRLRNTVAQIQKC